MSSSRPEFVLRAPAKINLWLRVHGKRADGYHELSTVMLALELSDELRGRCSDGQGIQLEVRGAQATGDISADHDNLVWRALNAVRERAESRGARDLPGFHVTLEKNIPSQAGLGGGSSDAASALRLGELLLGLDAGDEWRRQTLAGLGADCSFFHARGSSGLARCDGFGERVEPWPGKPPGWHIALLVPEVVCPTGQVFQALQLPAEPAPQEPFQPAFLGLELGQLRRKLSTDLEPAALRAVPELAAWRALLDNSGAAHFRLSGSGSAFFGVFTDPQAAHQQLKFIEQAASAKGLKLRACCVTQSCSGRQLWESGRDT